MLPRSKSLAAKHIFSIIHPASWFAKTSLLFLENNKITIGEIIRDFFGLLNVLQKNQQITIKQLISSDKSVKKEEKTKSELDNVFDRFESM